MSHKKINTSARTTAIGIAFGVICLAFVVVLAVVQIKGPSGAYASDDKNTRTVTVSGLRGEIYDRNGKLLVGNSTTHDLIYEYGAMPYSKEEVNKELLTVLRAVEQTKNTDKLCSDFFPIEGVYPNVRYISALSDSSSQEYLYFRKVLDAKKLKEDITAEELAEYYINRFEIYEKLYSPAEQMSLIKMWYEMDRIGFGAWQSYTIAENVSDELVTYINEAGVLGVTFKTVSQRVYHYPGVASHILGRVGKISAETAEYYTSLGYPLDAYVGVDGCELAFEAILHGQDGKMVIEYDDEGNITNKYYEREPISGDDVWLTIDIDLQIAAEEGLAETAASIDGAGGGAITALSPDTGDVLALASYPTYDLSRFSDKQYYASLLADKGKPLYNRALSGAYAPGSTYKVGVALAALENGKITDTDTCYCNQVYTGIASHPTCLGKHGSIDVYEAIQESCNIFFYSLGYAMGLDSVTDYTQRLGLGVSTGIELWENIGTVAGSEFAKENNIAWGKDGDVLGAIGQSYHTYTPLQLAVYMSSIVNGGTRFEAHLLSSVKHFYTSETLSSHSPKALDTVSFSSDTYNTLMSSMRRVVSENAEVRTYFKNVPVSVGGKTGTAEVAGQGDNALFCGFAPVEKPQIVVSCVIEEGQHGYYAAAATAKVLEKYFEGTSD